MKRHSKLLAALLVSGCYVSATAALAAEPAKPANAEQSKTAAAASQTVAQAAKSPIPDSIKPDGATVAKAAPAVDPVRSAGVNGAASTQANAEPSATATASAGISAQGSANAKASSPAAAAVAMQPVLHPSNGAEKPNMSAPAGAAAGKSSSAQQGSTSKTAKPTDQKAEASSAASSKPAVKQGGGVGITTTPGTVVKKLPGGGKTITTTIGGDALDDHEELVSAGPSAESASNGAGGAVANTPNTPEAMKALMESSGFQQRLLSSVMAQDARRREAAGRPAGAEKADSPYVTVIPGVVEVVPISKGFLNRIVTPFDNPRVYTINPIETRIDGNVVYVSTQSDNPIGLYIQDNTEDADDAAIALSLTPMDIPPRELRLKISGRGAAGGSSKAAEKWETGQPYVSAIKEVMKAMALNQLPQGYTLSPPTGLPFQCEIPGFAMKLGQMVDGHAFRIAVYVARNTSGQTREITEQACYRRGVAAVAAWPSAIIEPNQETEVFVAVRSDLGEEPKSNANRPSLINTQR